MKSAIVIGAGWAGLSAAVELAQRGHSVTVLEQSKRLGGRASSFKDDRTGQILDNGQHLFMGCYAHTIRFLETLGALDKLTFQKNLSVDFVDSHGQRSTLACPPLPAPFHLFLGLLRLKHLSFSEKMAMRKVQRAVASWNGNGSLHGLTVEEWLKSLGQSENSRKHFWDLITIAALNEESAVAEADSLAVVLEEGFFGSKEKSRIAIAGAGLSELLDPACKTFLAARGGKIRNDVLVSKIETEGDSVNGLLLRDGTRISAGLYVSALPFFVLKNVLDDRTGNSPFFSKIKNLESSPIFSISLWFDQDIMDREFAALLDTSVQWIFKKPGGRVSLVISGARNFLGMPDQELIQICLKDLNGCFPKSRSAKLVRFLIQREKNATLSPKVGHSQNRPSQKTPLKNFFLCGDWTDTGFPATIESAVWSGVKAAREIGLAATA